MTRRIALLIPSFRGGGTEGSNVRLANRLVVKGINVDMVVLSAIGPWRTELRPDVRLVDLGSSRASRSIPGLIRYLRQETPTILISNLSHINVASAIAHFLARSHSKLLLVERNDISSRSTEGIGLLERIIRFAMKVTFRRADSVLAVSRGAANSLADTLGMPRDEVGVVYNGIDIEQIRELANRPVTHPWLPADEIPVVIAAGRLVTQKAYPDLLVAFSVLRRKMRVRLIILGEGPLRARLTDLIDRLGIREDVDLAGFRKNPNAYIDKASLFALSSKSEGFPNVILEAMACGTPVVATDCKSGPREILDHGRYGLLVPVGDSSAIAEAVHQLLTDQTLAVKMSEAGYQRVHHFTVEQTVERVLGVLRDIGVSGM